MPEIHVTLLGRFAVTVDGVPVAEAGWKRRHAAAREALALYGATAR
jgi:DNA-binding SARP family transcriptional activator